MDLREIRFDSMLPGAAIKATHLPTGLWVYVDASPSSYRNREAAVEELGIIVRRSAALDEFGKLDGELMAKGGE